MPSRATASKVLRTDSAVSGVPSLKVTPSARWKVKVVASGLTSQLRASHGRSSPVRGS
ncbi:Uncharacterised protein [Mycobacteroides abscessus subsp. abscessus]|nr:Uncharacterised protein [Mycobacteroides abscessus subsp. abscessus]